MANCTICGFNNPEGNDYCEKCSSFLMREELYPTRRDEHGHDFFNLEEGDSFADKYIIEKKLGAGGLGTTYRIKDQQDGNLKRLKIFRRSLFKSQEIVDKFTSLLESLIEHDIKGIARVYEYDIHGGLYYVVSEYLQGQSLKNLILEKAPLSNELLKFLFIEVTRSLSSAHKKGLVHGNPNPFKIFYSEETKKVTINDYGISAVLLGVGKRELLSGDGALALSLHYTAPEIINGHAPTVSGDLYSLGAIFYEAACNYLPFQSHSAYRLVRRIINDPPELAAKLNPSLPLAISEALMLLLEKEPTDRYASADELLQVLEQSDGSSRLVTFLIAIAIVTVIALIFYIIHLLSS